MNKSIVVLLLLVVSISTFSGEMIVVEGVAHGQWGKPTSNELIQIAMKQAEDRAGTKRSRHSEWKISGIAFPGGTGIYQYRASAAFKIKDDEGPYTIKVSQFVYWSMNQFGRPEPLITDSYGKERIIKLAQFYCASEVIEPSQYAFEEDVENRTSGFDRISGYFSCKISQENSNWRTR